MSTNSNSQPTEMFISTKDLPKINWKNIVIEKPVTNSFTKKGTTTTIEWTTSDVHYKGSNDQKLPIFFELPPQIVWGVNGTWPLGTETENQTLENIEGYQICYPLTTLATMKNPTPEEAAVEKFFDSAWNKGITAMGEFTDADLLDGPAGSAYTTAEKKKNMAYAMKPVYEYPSTKDEKTGKKNIDTSKPKRIYIKLVTKAKGIKMQCLTKIYGPGDKLVSPIKYMSTPGNAVQGVCHPVVHWEGIFWGAHGKNTYGGSLKFRVVEMNFTPKSSAGLSHRRMLSPNADVEEVNGSGSSEGGDFAFKHPSGSGIVASDFALGDENTIPITTSGEGGDNGSDGGLSSQEEKEEDISKVANDAAKAKKREQLIAKKKQQLLEKRKAKK
jgi:hypothetical protein